MLDRAASAPAIRGYINLHGCIGVGNYTCDGSEPPHVASPDWLSATRICRYCERRGRATESRVVGGHGVSELLIASVLGEETVTRV